MAGYHSFVQSYLVSKRRPPSLGGAESHEDNEHPSTYEKLGNTEGKLIEAEDAAANEYSASKLKAYGNRITAPKHDPSVINQSFAHGGLGVGHKLKESPEAKKFVETRLTKEDRQKLGKDEINLPRVDNTHTVRWMSELSRDGSTMYKDKSLPEFIENNGKQLDTSLPLLHHEAAEYEWMKIALEKFEEEHDREPDESERKKIYLDAHHSAGNPAEKEWIEQNDFDWNAWEAWCRGKESHLEKEANSNPPPDSDVKPITHGHGDLEETVEQANDHCLFAWDQASVRRYDQDGRLHIKVANISKATVNPYLGKEIPDWEELGLEPDRIYKLLRDPNELAKAASTFNGLPLLSEHTPVSAEDHPEDKVIGASGTEARFEFPYLKNSLVVWPNDEIEQIENDEKKELSCAYRYTPVMTPGVFEGLPYDGVMTALHGNHIALVTEGRAGHDVLVGDSQENIEWAALERALTRFGITGRDLHV